MFQDRVIDVIADTKSTLAVRLKNDYSPAVVNEKRNQYWNYFDSNIISYLLGKFLELRYE